MRESLQVEGTQNRLDDEVALGKVGRQVQVHAQV